MPAALISAYLSIFLSFCLQGKSALMCMYVLCPMSVYNTNRILYNRILHNILIGYYIIGYYTLSAGQVSIDVGIEPGPSGDSTGMYVCMYVYMYVYVYICMYVHAYVSASIYQRGDSTGKLHTY
jgi:hypothetical protein